MRSISAILYQDNHSYYLPLPLSLHINCFALLHLAKHFNSGLFSVGLKPSARHNSETVDTELRLAVNTKWHPTSKLGMGKLDLSPILQFQKNFR